jgi:hypothetical protein
VCEKSWVILPEMIESQEFANLRLNVGLTERHRLMNKVLKIELVCSTET